MSPYVRECNIVERNGILQDIYPISYYIIAYGHIAYKHISYTPNGKYFQLFVLRGVTESSTITAESRYSVRTELPISRWTKQPNQMTISSTLWATFKKWNILLGFYDSGLRHTTIGTQNEQLSGKLHQFQLYNSYLLIFTLEWSDKKGGFKFLSESLTE